MKKLMAGLLTILMLAALLAGCGSTDPVSGVLYATSCTDTDGAAVVCFGDCLRLESDGSGVLSYNGTEYTLRYEYSAEDGSLRFRDAEGVRFEGRYDGKIVTGVYGERYEYRFEPVGALDGADHAGEYPALRCYVDGERVSCKDDSLCLNADGSGTATIDGVSHALLWIADGTSLTLYGEGFSMLDGHIENGEISGSCFGAEYEFTQNPPHVESGRYGATECTDADGTTAYYLDGEYLTIEDDGSGTVYYGGVEYDIQWTYEDEVFRFEDSDGDHFEGSYTSGTIEGLYGGTYRYVFRLNAEPVVEGR